MSVTERLSRTLPLTLGDGAAEDLVNWMSHVDANRSELREVLESNFARMDARFEQMDARFAQIDARFAQIDARLEQIDARFAQIDARFEQIDARFAQIDARFEQIERRFEQFETKMDTGFAAADTKLQTGLLQIEIRMERRFADLLKWSFVFWVGAVGAIAVLAGVMR